MIDRSLFNVEDFLIDNTFQAYCAGTDQSCVEYWENWLKANPDQQAVIFEAKRLYLILSGHKKPLNSQLSVFKNSIEKRMKKPVAFTKTKHVWYIAAAIALLLCMPYFLENKLGKVMPHTGFKTSFTTKAGERKRILLSDGSVVLLNAKSSLTLSESFNDREREVKLIGEAYFDVNHNKEKPFKVITEDFDIKVLGTTFNVKAYPNDPTSEATLINGLIHMEGKGTKRSSITLRPSQKVVFHREVLPEIIKKDGSKLPTHVSSEISINHYTKVNDTSIAEMAWTENRIEILDQNFDEVKSVLERWYDVQIQFSDEDLKDYRFTATFHNENIKQVLNALQKASHFKYEIEGKKIIISK